MHIFKIWIFRFFENIFWNWMVLVWKVAH